MFVTPRTYRLSQIPNRGLSLNLENCPSFRTLCGWRIPPEEIRRAADRMLVHQVGSVRIGEVARYTLTYTPSADRILPYPTELYVKIRNTCAIALRAAYLHGPYTLHASCYPSTFNPNRKFENHETEGVPQFEPHLQPGAIWDAVIPVPERVRIGATTRLGAPGSSKQESISWIIEIASQVVFSNTASVNYEVLVGRDAKSLELGAASIADLPAPGHLRDHKHNLKEQQKGHAVTVKGVYSESVKLQVDDTASLWTSPRFPSWHDRAALANLEAEHARSANLESHGDTPNEAVGASKKNKKRKKVHFVVLTHGLHSNLGADMLYVKESIDAAARQARLDRKKAKEEQKKNAPSSASASQDENESDDEEEEVIVRGFPGNAGKTERGIQYLGKRLAKYILLMTYPDQPYIPVKTKPKISFNYTFGLQKDVETPKVHASHYGSTIYRREPEHKDYAYQITSISFIGHSLGGLVQTYAIAYIQKHSPEFFDHIKPVNFVTMASPLLGLSHENPIYVKFALDFGLVGRTGQDLGLSWSAPSKMRSGWEAMIGGLGTDATKSEGGHPEPGAKPLLRILPSGPAHQVLKRFKNRTVYSNVVNDGIVPLRTSCLLFLDWRGLEKVEKARRENGLVGTVAEWGWAALTGAPSSQLRAGRALIADQEGLSNAKTGPSKSSDSTSTNEQRLETSSDLPAPSQFLSQQQVPVGGNPQSTKPNKSVSSPTPNPFQVLMSFLKIQKSTKENKAAKIYKRSQTVRSTSSDRLSKGDGSSETQSRPPGRARGDSFYEEGGLNTPPRTTLFESAGDVIKPPLPSLEFLLDPSTRPRTIFHDRVYHPEDIPPPPPARPRTIFRSSSHNSTANGTNNNTDNSSQSGSNVPPQQTSQGLAPNLSSGMKVEEKIARAYHRDMSWRKVLVRLEPDAHNNIIVRRMFANAHGWPVVKHLVDTHFAYTRTATTATDNVRSEERALPMDTNATEHGEEVQGQTDKPSHVPSPSSSGQTNQEQLRPHKDTTGCNSEENDTVPEMLAPIRLNTPRVGSPRMCSSPVGTEDGCEESSHRVPNVRSRASSVHSKLSRQSSAQWTDRYLEDGEEDDYFDDVEEFEEIRDTFTVRSPSSSPGPSGRVSKTDIDGGDGGASQSASQPRKADSKESEVD